MARPTHVAVCVTLCMSMAPIVTCLYSTDAVDAVTTGFSLRSFVMVRPMVQIDSHIVIAAN